MKRWIAFLSVTGLFVIGILIGALGMRLHGLHGGFDPPGPRPESAHALVMRFHDRLGLTPEQMRTIEAILVEAHAEAEEFRTQMAPRVREHLERTHERIAEVLTREQRAVLEEMIARHRGQTHEWFLGPPGRARGGPHGPHLPPPR